MSDMCHESTEEKSRLNSQTWREAGVRKETWITVIYLGQRGCVFQGMIHRYRNNKEYLGDYTKREETVGPCWRYALHWVSFYLCMDWMVLCVCLTGLALHPAPPCESVVLSQRRVTIPRSCSREEHTCLMSWDTRASWDRDRLSRKLVTWQSTS